MISTKKWYDNESAVSVLVGTLALIAVVIAGTIGIATIVGGFSTDVSKQASPGKSVAATQTPLYIAGSDNMDILTQSLRDSYTAENPSVRIISGVISPDSVYNALNSKTIDIGARAGLIDDVDLTKNPNIQMTQVGSSAIVVITNKSGPNKATLPNYTDLQNFFTGGPKGAYVTAEPVIRSDKSGTADTFYNKFLGKPTLTSFAGAHIEGSDAALIAYVAASPDAIGFADYGDVEKAITENGVQISIMSTQDATGHNNLQNNVNYDRIKIAAKFDYLSTQRHADGSPYWTGTQNDLDPNAYSMSLTYPLYYVTKDNPNTLQKGFLDFATSPAARPAFAKANMFSVADF